MIPRNFIFFLFICIYHPLNAQSEWVKSFTWLEGKWKIEDGSLYESWEYSSKDSVFKGKGYEIIRKGETETESVFETLRIFRLKDTIYYGAQVGAKETLFQYVPGKKKEFRFENLHHDFPQKIVYYRKTKTRAIAILTGIENGNSKKITFQFYRVE